jgi:hypothetical protein
MHWILIAMNAAQIENGKLDTPIPHRCHSDYGKKTTMKQE